MLNQTMKFSIRTELAAKFFLRGYALFFAVSVAVSNVFLVAAALAALIYCMKNREFVRLPGHYVRSFLAFFGIMLFLACMSDPLFTAMVRYEKTILRLTPLLLLILFIKDKKEIDVLCFWMMISILVTDGRILWQGLHGDWRAMGFFSHPMYFAGMAVQFMPFLLIFFIGGKGKRKILPGLLFLLSCSALLFNGTRGAWLALAVILPCCLFLFCHNIKKVISAVLIAGALGYFIFSNVGAVQARFDTLTDMQYQSNAERLLLWQSAWEMFRQHPFLGVGYGNFQHYYQNFYISPLAKEPGLGHAHNNVINTLAETGIVGCSALLFLWGSFFYYSYRDWKKTRNPLALAFMSAAWGLFLQGLTESNFGNSVVMNYYYFLMGLYLASMKLETGKFSEEKM